MSFDIIVIGSASVDVFVKTEARIIQIQGVSHGRATDECLLAYPLGSKLLIEQLEFHPGGGGANACVTFARLGFATAFIGMIGADHYGQLLLNWLSDNHIAFLGEQKGQTGYSLILASQANDRTILSFKGCNNELEWTEALLERLQTRWVYGASMLERSFNTQERLFILAKELGARTAYNPNPYICCRGLHYLRTMLRHTDVLILNREEAGLLVGDGEPPQLAARLLQQGPGIVAVTDGARGVTVCAGPAWGGEAWSIGPAANLHIVDTTGAGDAFGSGFIAALNWGKSIREAALLGVLNAEDVIQACGPKNHRADRRGAQQRLLSEATQPRHAVAKIII